MLLAALVGTALAAEPAKKEFPPTETFTVQMGHFADSLHNGTRPIHSVEEGRAVLELILKASESSEGWQKTAVAKPSAAGGPA